MASITEITELVNSVNTFMSNLNCCKRNDTDKENLKKQGLDAINIQTTLVFNRFHYYLVSMAFLVAAFAAILSADNVFDEKKQYLVILALAVAFIGSFLSFFFTFVLYYNSQMVISMGELLRNLVKLQKRITNISEFGDVAIKSNVLNLNFFKHLGDFVHNPFDSKLHAPFTWTVTMFFSLLWGAAFIWTSYLSSSYCMLIVYIVLCVISIIVVIHKMHSSQNNIRKGNSREDREIISDLRECGIIK